MTAEASVRGLAGQDVVAAPGSKEQPSLQGNVLTFQSFLFCSLVRGKEMLDNYDAQLPYMETEAQEVKNSLGPCPVSYRVRVSVVAARGKGRGKSL